jgi:hypothetical protein
VRDGGVAAEEDAGEVRRNHAVPVGIAHVGDVGERADPGVVHEDIDAAEATHGGPDQAIDVRPLPHVGANRFEAMLVTRQRAPGRVEVFLAQPADRDVGALVEQRRRDGQADAAGATGHHRGLRFDV